MGLLHRKTETEPIREKEAYERLHGERSGEIRVVPPGEKPPREPEDEDGDLTGEHLRRAFESKLDTRE